jgi:acyl-CoA oxidase
MSFCILGGVHSFLYTRAMFLLGTEKHKEFILRGTAVQEVGCFGLTELYHGSNVKGIQTEAHYDHKNKEFVINSPHKEAMKFWIGGAAKTASMSVIWAQLYI